MGGRRQLPPSRCECLRLRAHPHHTVSSEQTSSQSHTSLPSLGLAAIRMSTFEHAGGASLSGTAATKCSWIASSCDRTAATTRLGGSDLLRVHGREAKRRMDMRLMLLSVL